MRNYPSNLFTLLQTRKGFRSRVLVWVDNAQNLSNGTTESLGLWNGAGNRVFTIGGVDRTYYGAGALLNVPPIAYASDLTVRRQKTLLAAISPAVKTILRGYDVRFAPIEVHRAIYDGETGLLNSEPHELMRGFIDDLKFTRPAPGSGNSTAETTIATWLRKLTLVLPLKRSDATQQLDQGDRFRRYIDVPGTVGVWWAQSRS